MDTTEGRTGTPPGNNNRGHHNLITPGAGEESPGGIGDRHETPPQTREALRVISDFEFDPTGELAQKKTEDEAIAAALMMFSPTAGTEELPKLKTDKWPYDGRDPDPITIGTARKLLAAAYAEIPCELGAAGDHGYAWIIEPTEVWKKRSGVQDINPPNKPLEVTVFDMKMQWEFAVKSKRYAMYRHLVHEGKTKIMTWFGKERFVDLFVDGLLPPRVTAQELLEHISETYATPQANRTCMEKVEDEVNSPYDLKQPVEGYFLRLQEAQGQAKMLGVEYSAKQIMNKALKQFETHYGKEAYKAEKKWNERTEDKQSWTHFKLYWKEEIHQWNAFAARGKKTQAHNAIDMDSLVDNVSALQAEARSLQENNTRLVEQLQFHQALQTQHIQTQQFSQDDISTITDQLVAGIGRQLACTRIPADGSANDTTWTGTRTQELLHTARTRNPRDYSNLNSGKGKRFVSYCWKCGCNCTHWTKKCLELTGSERRKYRDADFDDLMGGSTKFLDRRGKYQSDYDFDSL